MSIFYRGQHEAPADYTKSILALGVAGILTCGFAFGVIYDSKRVMYLEEVNERLRIEKTILQEELKKTFKKRTQNLGDFICTAYCACSKCCGHTHGITKSGTVATANRTIAVDTRHIPLGTKVCINGKWYVAEDTGKSIKGRRIDIFFDSHEEALEFGKQTHSVVIERAEA